ncbi:MAG: M1.BsrBI [Parcubacteria group bacterium GW2011_GWC1_35_21]|nr:MAG: M1.BsrBI [Parcubacteria group bacterium GW2011_GWC1_35_21]
MTDIKVKTPFRYPGGKFYAIKYLLPYIAQIPHDEYREPFVGGGSVFFGKPKVKNNWINDIDAELMNIYKIFQDKNLYKKLLKRFQKEVANPVRYREIKKLDPKSNLEKAFRYYYLNRTSYSGKMISASWGYREKRSIPPERWREVVEPAHDKLSDTKITNLDFEDLIKKPSKRKVFLYIDPPYFLPLKKKHYINGFTKEDHLRLMKLLKQTKHAFLLSYEDCPEIRELYSWAKIYKLAFPYRVQDSNTSNSKRKTGQEVVISNIEFSDYEKLRII